MKIDMEDDEIVDDIEDSPSFPQVDEELLDTLKGDCKELAKSCIHQFFEGKTMHCGGVIPKSTLESESYVDLVLHCSVCDGTDIVYDALAAASAETIQRVMNKLGVCSCKHGFEDANILLTIHRQCKAKGIHKVFVGGLTIMYLELCLGVEIKKNAAA